MIPKPGLQRQPSDVPGACRETDFADGSTHAGWAAPVAEPMVCLGDDAVVAQWCRRYSITADQLSIATTMVGVMPAALHYYLSSRGRKTKVVTEEMRASRKPIPPRDRRKKKVAVPD